MKNPIPLIHQYSAIKVSAIAQLYPPGTPLSVIHGLFFHDEIAPDTHKRLFDLTMTCWGTCTDKAIKRSLWQCYFPDTRPHIYHMLVFEHAQEHAMINTTKLTKSMIDRYVRQPKLKRFQLQKVTRFALQYIEAIGSKSRKEGPDPRYMRLYYALRDQKRLYQPGEIVVD